MKIPVITSFFERRNRSRLRSVMRGYCFLKKTDSLNRIADLNRLLTTQKLGVDAGSFSIQIFGAGINQAELVCRQYLLTRLSGLNLNRALLYELGKPGAPGVFNLPPEWRKIVREQGFKVAELRSSLHWNAFVFMMLWYGLFKISQIVLQSIKSIITQKKPALGNYVYFDSLVPGTLPQLGRDGRSYDIVTWYMQWVGRHKGVKTLCHGIKCAQKSNVDGTPVISVPGPIPLFSRFTELVHFITWGIKTILMAAFDLLRGRWWHALLLNQAALSAQARMQDPDRLAKDYLFHNSSWFNRPLWTYEAEKSSSRVMLYFYSTNCDPFKTAQEYPLPYYGYQAMNWPCYLVWDDYQADFIRRMVGDAADIKIVGPIWFSSSTEEMPSISGKSVAVFDVTPFRSSRYEMLGLDFEYYLPKTSIDFLGDIQKTAENSGYFMTWKRKRKIGVMAHPRYRYYADQVSECDNVMSIDPDISAYRVIEVSIAVISMPFTSTALIARELGKPSCYYDPTGLLQKDDRAAHGIEIINNLEELETWFKTAL